MWDFPFPYAPIKIRALFVESVDVLSKTSSRSFREDLVGIKLEDTKDEESRETFDYSEWKANQEWKQEKKNISYIPFIH